MEPPKLGYIGKPWAMGVNGHGADDTIMQVFEQLIKEEAKDNMINRR